MPKILIPKTLTKLVNGASCLILNCKQLNELGSCLQKEYPQLYSALYSDVHQLKNFVCIYLNAALIRDVSKENISVSDQDTIEILIAIAGG